jgi:hypothetical protein
MGYRLLAKFLNCNISTAIRYTDSDGILASAKVEKYNKAWVFDKKKCIKLLKETAQTHAWAEKIYDNIPDENKKI